MTTFLVFFPDFFSFLSRIDQKLVRTSEKDSIGTHPFTDDLSVTIDEIHRWAPMTQPSVYIGDRPQSPSVAIDDLLYDGAAVYDGE